jgi:hypothetical protein
MGSVPDPGQSWETYTAEEASDDLDRVSLN